MGEVGSFAGFLLRLASISATSVLAQGPQSPHNFAGVFLLVDGGKYTYTFSAAAAACRALNTTAATLEQMERALQSGLETCKYGWTAEQTAVIPRLMANKNCGQGKTGVVTWFASPDKKFGAFCFNASDLEEPSNASTPSSSPPTTWTTPSFSSSSFFSPASSASSMSAEIPTTSTTEGPVTATPATSPSSGSALTGSTLTGSALTGSATGPATSTLGPSPMNVPERATWKPADVAVPTFSFSASSVPSTVSVSTQATATAPTSPATPFLGGVSRTLVIIGVVMLLLAAAALVCYYKLNVFSFWPAGQLKDDVETEMWNNDESEADLPCPPEEEDEEDRKYSGDITLCVNPNFRSKSSLV